MYSVASFITCLFAAESTMFVSYGVGRTQVNLLSIMSRWIHSLVGSG